MFLPRGFRTFLFCVLLAGNTFPVFADEYTDSLELAAKTTTDPQQKIKLLNELFLQYEFSDLDKATQFLEEAFQLAINSPYKQELATVYTHKGYFAEDTGNYKASEENYKLALELSLEINDLRGIFAGYNHMGVTYKYQADFPRSLSYYLKALELLEKWEPLVLKAGTETEIRQLKKGFASIYNNIGNLHYNQSNYADAEPYFLKSVALDHELKNDNGLSIDYNNLALLYWRIDDYEKSISYYDSCIALNTKMNSKLGLSESLMNRAITFKYMALEAREKGNNELADSLFERIIADNNQSLEFKKTTGDKLGTANALHNLGIIYYEMGQFKQARDYYQRSQKILLEIGNKTTLVNSYKISYQLDSTERKWQSAFINFGNYVRLKDSLINEDNTKKIVQMEMNHLFEQERAQDSLMHAESDKIKDAQIAAQEATILQERTFKIALFSGLAMVIIFAFIIFNRLRVTRRQKTIIEQQKLEVELQKEVVEEKNKEILDSINYAKRIQDAILPPLSQLNKVIPDSFILYLPKDIVAGDFYWIEQKEHLLYFAVADCTGHGVPGAMVSVLCSNALSKCVKELNISSPAQILDKTAEILQTNFEKSGQTMNDGMDIALTVVDLKTNTLTFAGANNPLYLIRNNELHELKGDKQPVGKFDNRKPYTNQPLSLQQGDCIYLFTDGYADQFGGKEGKKFKYKNLKNLLVEHTHKPMRELSQILELEFKNWRGGLEQIDDICIAGIRID